MLREKRRIPCSGKGHRTVRRSCSGPKRRKPDGHSGHRALSHLYRVGHEGLEPSANGLRVPGEDPEVNDSGRLGMIGSEEIGPEAPERCMVGHQRDASGTNPVNPRTALVAALTDGIKVATMAGDLEAARVAFEALAQLIAGQGAVGGSAVIELQARREGRGQR